MNFKLDENLPDSLRDLLNDAGHDAVTVADQGIECSADGIIASICREETRAIMTMDLDFADIRAYPPHLYSGILVFRLADQDQRNLLAVGIELVPKLSDHALAGKLWIVEESRIRIREKERCLLSGAKRHRAEDEYIVKLTPRRVWWLIVLPVVLFVLIVALRSAPPS